MQIAGSTTVITGGASGLGRATAERLHGGGGRVVLLDLGKSPGKEVAAALGDRALFAPADVTSAEEVGAALEAAVARFGALHADRKSTRLNSSHIQKSRMPSSA